MPQMKCIIFLNPRKPNIITRLHELTDTLESYGINWIIDGTLPTEFRENYPTTTDFRHCDYYLTLGGDGTLLSILRKKINFSVPIIPINLGYLGFMAYYSLEQLAPLLEVIAEGKHHIEKRGILEINLLREEKVIRQFRALNDLVMAKSSLSKLITFEIFADEHYVNCYRADGIIIATPTGSTAHSLSAGGPIVHPSKESFILTPICPHTLSNRPILLPWRSKIRIHYLSPLPHQASITADGQVGNTLLPNDEIMIKRYHKKLRIVSWNVNYYKILRSKLNWGA